MKDVVIIDVDGVLVNTHQGMCFLYNQEWDDALSPEQITDWETSRFVKPECGEKVDAYYARPEVYDHSPAIRDSLMGLRTLRELGFETWLVTASRNPGQYLWLLKNGYIALASEYIQSKRKDIFPARYIIDDRPETVASFPGIAILFDQPWNRSFEWQHRAHGWGDAVNLLLKLREEHQPVSIPGIGKDAPMTVNENGGRQSKLDYRFDLIDPLAVFALSRVLAEGAAKYEEWNWVLINERDNINHALVHLYAHLAGDTGDDHLAHAFTRIMFALSKHLGRAESNLPSVVRENGGRSDVL